MSAYLWAARGPSVVRPCHGILKTSAPLDRPRRQRGIKLEAALHPLRMDYRSGDCSTAASRPWVGAPLPRVCRRSDVIDDATRGRRMPGTSAAAGRGIRTGFCAWKDGPRINTKTPMRPEREPEGLIHHIDNPCRRAERRASAMPPTKTPCVTARWWWWWYLYTWTWYSVLGQLVILN
ncbi:hypothetical protein BO70DRAFT_86484 [Aspergillus heteromorphus CBS 117.55]|uniref:Uncharacterized protein n=1 Tax=Aspergillus heteromorphus CBS 117.55 TaxID=1448321 RepID=A0A317WXK7_9EURO|nr:uncharacterized protein BO70DRAFT_86484 [Aspergillus heteromorphus CBS 117.55]PWY91146.1 hypothetical protein BO70DRAFT_86484 [Aspergillus heteromorphus CBS 117.55]